MELTAVILVILAAAVAAATYVWTEAKPRRRRELPDLLDDDGLPLLAEVARYRGDAGSGFDSTASDFASSDSGGDAGGDSGGDGGGGGD